MNKSCFTCTHVSIKSKYPAAGRELQELLCRLIDLFQVKNHIHVAKIFFLKGKEKHAA
jgi:predicted small metal-binding protein